MHVAIQIVISRGHCILIQCTALHITTLFAVLYSRKFNGCYNSHIVLSFVYLVVLCLNVARCNSGLLFCVNEAS